MIPTSILAVILKLIVVTAVEEIDETGDAGLGVNGEVDDAFLRLLTS